MWILLTGLLSALLTRLQIRLNSRLGLTAAPRADRWHRVPTPSSGGLAIFLSCAAAYWLACPGRYPRIALAAAALWIFGFLDDRLNLQPRLKLAVQVAAAFVVFGGLVFPLTHYYPLDAALSMFWIVMITNALNLIDNMDGLCAGVVIIICLFRSWLLSAEGYRTDAELCAILAGAFGGFLIFNYHPARIFMGDCGTMPAGFALGALTLAGPAPHGAVVLAGFFYPALTFAYPIFDTALVSVLRKLAGRPISVGGRDHSSHRLASLGLDQRQVVCILWLLTGFGSSLGVMIHLMPGALFPAIALLAALLSLFAVSLARPASTSNSPHSLDSTAAFVLASRTPFGFFRPPMEAACSRTMTSSR
ncbi:MAG TPA: MraY family glycosyltransferase [Bryobacteraceae bacterium]|nr:MraY family glycosyltransferase [Bryobacteraceae bacterium]